MDEKKKREETSDGKKPPDDVCSAPLRRHLLSLLWLLLASHPAALVEAAGIGLLVSGSTLRRRLRRRRLHRVEAPAFQHIDHPRAAIRLTGDAFAPGTGQLAVAG